MSGKVLGTEAFDSLIPLLAELGYRVVGPTVREEAIVWGDIEAATDLPIGWTDVQEAGHYRIEPRDDNAYFAYTVGPRTLKTYLFPARQTLLTIENAETGLRFRPEPLDEPPYAFLGVRACEIAAAAIQDSVFDGSSYADPSYVARRKRSFTIAVNCSVAGNTCFCDSMGTGPRASDGFDLVVTEILDGNRHEFVVESGSERGAAVLNELSGRAAAESDEEAIVSIMKNTIDHMGRSMDEKATRALLAENLDHPIWDDIATRCLACTNCTLVCPTCFCSTVEDATDLLGSATRTRRWDSCFSSDFSNLHGHPVRSSTRSKYRQWMTHKLSYWYDQFGMSGCVGCGRCITWCPVAIDITAEMAQLNEESEAST
jgi:ferredoxin